MVTLGIDLSSQAKNTAACEIDWSSGEVTSCERCTDAQLDRLIARANVVAIDAPFGWPNRFVAALNDWTDESWTNSIRDELRFRETDRVVKERTKARPLSVSSDRIALPAMRARAILRRHRVNDLGRDQKFVEVYPAASLAQWGFGSNGYKGKEAANLTRRRNIVRGLRRELPSLRVSSEFERNDHVLDALIAALTARARYRGHCIRPAENQEQTSRREGWIYFPDARQRLAACA